MTRGWIGFYFIIFRGHLESEPFWGSQRGQEAKEKQREVSCSRAAKDDWDGSLRSSSREIEELVLQAGDSRKRELGGGENPTQGSTPGMFIVNHIFFLFWVSFYWMSLLIYVFVYTLVLLILSLFHGSGLRN